MLDRVGGFMHDVGLIVRSHHERWDGRGYPDGLAGEAIPLEARIISCCDTWNAMRTDRSYRPALSHEVARAELVANAGHQFDPRIVTAFLELIEHDPSEQTDPHTRPAPPAADRRLRPGRPRALPGACWRATSRSSSGQRRPGRA